MTGNVQKISLAGSRDIPFNKLVLSQANVRRVKAGLSIEQLADDVARRGLLQGLSVRAIVDQDGVATGMYEIPAGGRRYRALELLVKRKRLARNAPVPCIVREGGVAEEDSLAENIQRAPLHPLDQFRAFLALRERGQSEEEIAATFFVSVQIVKQRLKLASVSPKLLDIYAEDGMSLDQLMAFTVCSDPVRQEQVFERVQTSYDKQPWLIRRWLTEGAVRAADKRAQFIGLDAYLARGGAIERDLFQGDDGGWLHDVALVDALTAEKLGEAAARVQGEGWKWVEVAPDFPYGHVFGLRRLRGEPIAITPEEQAARDALQAEYDQLVSNHEHAAELPEDVDARLGEVEAAIEAIDERPLVFDPDEIARAGAFVSIGGGGRLQVERGYVRPEDELPVAPEPAPAGTGLAEAEDAGTVEEQGDAPGPVAPAEEEDEGLKPLSDRLVSELTAYRTIALRQAICENPAVAFLAVLHALTLRVFFPYTQETCLELDLKTVSFPAQAPGLTDSAPAEALRDAHDRWRTLLPAEPGALWETLLGWDDESREALFAYVAGQAVNAAVEPYNRRPRAIAHADALARLVDLDVAATGWRANAANYLGRVSKSRIMEAVGAARGKHIADGMAQLKKADMVARAEDLMKDSGWVPEPLRTPGADARAGRSEAGDSDLPQGSAVGGEEGAVASEGAGLDDDSASGELGPDGHDEHDAGSPADEAPVATGMDESVAMAAE